MCLKSVALGASDQKVDPGEILGFLYLGRFRKILISEYMAICVQKDTVHRLNNSLVERYRRESLDGKKMKQTKTGHD